MAKSKAEIEIQWIKNNLIPKIFKNKHFQEDNGLQDYTNDKVTVQKIEVKIIGPDEAFMLTLCYRALITFEQGDSGPKTTKLFVKKTPNLPKEVFDSIQFAPLFSNEILAYKTITPAFENFAQQTFNIPRFYYGNLGENHATVVLQDFGVSNWHLAKQKVNLSLEHTLVAIGNLGNFHGIGFALKHTNRAEFERITKDLKESRYDKNDLNEKLEILFRTSAERVVLATKKYQTHVNVEFLHRFQRLIEDYLAFGRQMVKPVEPFVTLCHGDYLRNNIAFKYAKDNEEPYDSLMFDLQTMRLCSPMLDFAIFLSLSCFAAVRCQHFDQIFCEYHQQLIKSFKQCARDSKIPDFLSRDSLLSEYRRYLPYGISTASYFLKQLVEPVQLTSEEFIMHDSKPEELRKETLSRGGEVVDRELAHQMKELYDCVQKYNLDIFKGFDYV